MIGSFRFDEDPGPAAVVVRLMWDRHGRRTALVELPVVLQEAVTQGEWPDCSGQTSLEAALSYSLFICLRAGASLFLSGDRTVWDTRWGTIESVH